MADFEFDSDSDTQLIYKFLTNRDFSQDYAAEISELSAKFYDENEQFNGAEHIFPGGYSQITNILASNLDIQLNKIVTSIDYSGA